MNLKIKISDFEKHSNVNFSDLSDKINSFGITLSEDGPWIAGGSVRRVLSSSKESHDYDFFFRNEEQLKKTVSQIKGELVKENKFNTLYNCGDKVQLIIHNFFDSPEELIESFDFTICQFAFDGKNLYHGVFSLWDLGRKRLAINKITYATSTVRRLLKYCSQGFTACSGTCSSILKEVSHNPSLVNEDIVYID